MREALTRHWPEYAIEAAGLGLFMVSACLFGALLYHPASAAPAAIPDPLLRRALMGLAMGLTAIALIYSPWGQRSGAHFNPAVTLTFLRLGRVAGRDALHAMPDGDRTAAASPSPWAVASSPGSSAPSRPRSAAVRAHAFTRIPRGVGVRGAHAPSMADSGRAQYSPGRGWLTGRSALVVSGRERAAAHFA